LALLVLGIAIIVRELRKPTEERTWHGEVAGWLPYDFRKPTMERIRQVSWNSDGPIISNKAWGIGWTLNFGAIKKAIGA